jgi:hypothetical protein
MHFRVGIAVLGVAFTCVSCTGHIVKNIRGTRDTEDRADGAVVGYYLPKAIWTVTAKFDKDSGMLSAEADPKPTILPDTDYPMQYLSYAHSGLSDDDVDVTLNNLMLTSEGCRPDRSYSEVDSADTRRHESPSREIMTRPPGIKYLLIALLLIVLVGILPGILRSIPDGFGMWLADFGAALVASMAAYCVSKHEPDPEPESIPRGRKAPGLSDRACG